MFKSQFFILSRRRMITDPSDQYLIIQFFLAQSQMIYYNFNRKLPLWQQIN